MSPDAPRDRGEEPRKVRLGPVHGALQKGAGAALASDSDKLPKPSPAPGSGSDSDSDAASRLLHSGETGQRWGQVTTGLQATEEFLGNAAKEQMSRQERITDRGSFVTTCADPLIARINAFFSVRDEALTARNLGTRSRDEIQAVVIRLDALLNSTNPVIQGYLFGVIERLRVARGLLQKLLEESGTFKSMPGSPDPEGATTAFAPADTHAAAPVLAKTHEAIGDLELVDASATGGARVVSAAKLNRIFSGLETARPAQGGATFQLHLAEGPEGLPAEVGFAGRTMVLNPADLTHTLSLSATQLARLTARASSTGALPAGFTAADSQPLAVDGDVLLIEGEAVAALPPLPLEGWDKLSPREQAMMHDLCDPLEQKLGVKIQSIAGKGSMGMVLIAHHTGFECLVALKVGLPKDPGGGGMQVNTQKALQKEAKVMRACDHPAIVKPDHIDSVQSQTGRDYPFLMMKLQDSLAPQENRFAPAAQALSQARLTAETLPEWRVYLASFVNGKPPTGQRGPNGQGVTALSSALVALLPLSFWAREQATIRAFIAATKAQRITQGKAFMAALIGMIQKAETVLSLSACVDSLGQGALDGKKYQRFVQALLESGVAVPPAIAKLMTKLSLMMSRDLARGLQRVHEQGYLHHDVKAANIYVSPDAAGPVISLLRQFAEQTIGISQKADLSPQVQACAQHLEAIAKSGDSTAFLSDMGVSDRSDAKGKDVAGSANHMPFEKFLGRTGRADSYALAVTCLELLIGTEPFQNIRSVHEMFGAIYRLPQDKPGTTEDLSLLDMKSEISPQALAFLKANIPTELFTLLSQLLWIPRDTKALQDGDIEAPQVADADIVSTLTRALGLDVEVERKTAEQRGAQRAKKVLRGEVAKAQEEAGRQRSRVESVLKVGGGVVTVIILLAIIGVSISKHRADQQAEGNVAKAKERLRLSARASAYGDFESRLNETLGGQGSRVREAVARAMAGKDPKKLLDELDDLPEDLLGELLSTLSNGTGSLTFGLQTRLDGQASEDTGTRDRERRALEALLAKIDPRSELLAVLARPPVPEPSGTRGRKPTASGGGTPPEEVIPDPVDHRTLAQIAKELRRAFSGRLDALDSALTRLRTEVPQFAWEEQTEGDGMSPAKGDRATVVLKGPGGKAVTDAKTFDEFWELIEAMRACAKAAADDDETVSGLKAKERLDKLTPEMEQLAKTLGMSDLAFTLRRAVELIPGATDSRFFKEKLERFTTRARATHARSGLGEAVDIEALLAPLEAMLGENMRTATEMAATITDTMKERGIDLFDGRFAGTVLNVKGYPLEEGSEERMKELTMAYKKHLDAIETHGATGLIAEIEIFFRTNEQDITTHNRDLLGSEDLNNPFNLERRSKASGAGYGALNVLIRAANARHAGKPSPLIGELATIPGIDAYLARFFDAVMKRCISGYNAFSSSGNPTFTAECDIARGFMVGILNVAGGKGYYAQVFPEIRQGSIRESLPTGDPEPGV
ncbi:MAG: hypothetical protein Q8P95_04550, partial [bacterium]|nr:hypothetical protein [bacterium]